MKRNMKNAVLIFITSVFSAALQAGPGSGCDLRVTEVGTDSGGNFRFTSNSSYDLSYKAMTHEVSRVAMIAYLTGTPVCINVADYTSSEWRVKQIRLMKF